MAGLDGACRRVEAVADTVVVDDPEKFIADLAVAIARGRDCQADLAVLHAQPELAYRDWRCALFPDPGRPVVSRR